MLSSYPLNSAESLGTEPGRAARPAAGVAGRGREPSPLRDRFTLKTEGGYLFLPFDDVMWIEAQGDYVKFHAGPRSCLVRMTMKALDGSLVPGRFLRVHRSAAVNLDQVERIRWSGAQRAYQVILRDGRTVPIGVGYRTVVKALFESAFGPMAAISESAVAPHVR